MAAADPATTAAPAASSCDSLDLDTKLLFTAGAVGLYATSTIIKDLYRTLWGSNDKTPSEVRPMANATPNDEMVVFETPEDENQLEHETNWGLGGAEAKY